MQRVIRSSFYTIHRSSLHGSTCAAVQIVGSSPLVWFTSSGQYWFTDWSSSPDVWTGSSGSVRRRLNQRWSGLVHVVRIWFFAGLTRRDAAVAGTGRIAIFSWSRRRIVLRRTDTSRCCSRRDWSRRDFQLVASPDLVTSAGRVAVFTGAGLFWFTSSRSGSSSD